MENYNNINHYKVIEKIGGNSLAKIYKVLNIKDNKYYAMKKIDINYIDKEELLLIEKEAELLSSINSEYIVKYYNSFLENNEYFNIIMEYCENSDLNQFINKKRDEKKLKCNFIYYIKYMYRLKRNP